MVSRTRGEKVFNVFNLTVLGLVGLMALYPFVQKYFVRGIMLGSVKE